MHDHGNCERCDHIGAELASARVVVEAARARLALEGHEIGCQFRGCTCGRYDEAKAARQDVQRALAAHDAEWVT